MNAVPRLRTAKGLLASMLLVLSTTMAEQKLYLSAGDRVTAFSLDERSGRLVPVQAVELPGAGPIGSSPDRSRLYVSARLAKTGEKGKPEPGIATFRVKLDGRLELMAHASVRVSAGYLRVDATGRFLAGNNYREGTVSVWKIEEDGAYRGVTVVQKTLEPRAHSAVFSPDNRFLLVPATGPNKVFQMHFDAETGEIRSNDPPFAEGPQGESEARQPRHLVFHPTLPVAYTTNEREHPGVGVWEWDEESGTLKTIQNLVSIPPEFQGVITTADLHLTPDGRFLYVSNRDLTDRKARTGNSSLAVFGVDSKSGRLTPAGHFACEHLPRSFHLDASGSYVYVAGQADDRLGVYEIHRETGALKKVEQMEVGARPSWVHCMALPAP